MRAWRNEKTLYSVFAVLFILTMLMQLVPLEMATVEALYSRGFYRLYQKLPQLLFGNIGFSVGDIFYVGAALAIGYCLVNVLLYIFRRAYKRAALQSLSLISFVLFLYVVFQAGWGLNYRRIPLATQLELQTDTITMVQHTEILERYIGELNALGQAMPKEALNKGAASRELALWMRADTLFQEILAPHLVRVKAPLSSHLISYFSVTGYFNPFTNEVHVNADVPAAGYPFTIAHELAHQMGIGFEDECNFIAFVKLQHHPNVRYRYAAYYSAVQYLLRPIYVQDEQLYRHYLKQLSPRVMADLQEERAYWQAYSGWFNQLTDFFYSGYLKHNKQPEGMARYSLMSRLVIAWEYRH